jgi:pimeloyl-ACP methyl ester carboxylesterase
MGTAAAAGQAESRLERVCLREGWRKLTLSAAGLDRKVLWKGPQGPWRGAILALHGGGGEAAHFCAGGGLVRPQIAFASMAIERGFAVFALDATTDEVTDAQGRPCGKRFDFSVLDRPNLDLPYIERILTQVVPSSRPAGSGNAIFMTGLSTGGYMTIRASTHFADRITAFAPVSAGDPYGTDAVCDTSLSRRESAKGILADRETGREIVEDDACKAPSYGRESPWPTPSAAARPPFKQFQHEDDGIVDISCMRKAATLLERKGHPNAGAFIIEGWGRKSAFKHLWLEEYNEPLLGFFASQAGAGRPLGEALRRYRPPGVRSAGCRTRSSTSPCRAPRAAGCGGRSTRAGSTWAVSSPTCRGSCAASWSASGSPSTPSTCASTPWGSRR